jgi:hypothetical protein
VGGGTIRLLGQAPAKNMAKPARTPMDPSHGIRTSPQRFKSFLNRVSQVRFLPGAPLAVDELLAELARYTGLRFE